LVIVIALQAPDFRIERSATIAAPAATVFGHVNHFQKWLAWSPFEGIDPGMKRTFEGPPEGVGAIYRWSGNSRAGEGAMTITESHPAERIAIKMEFAKPFVATNTVTFTFQSDGPTTVITWAMSGKKNAMAKALHLVVDMDKMIGKGYETGLAQLKSIAERSAQSESTKATGTG
jgi:hypothetical protein